MELKKQILVLGIIYGINFVAFLTSMFYINSIDKLEIIEDWENNNRIFYDRLILTAQAELGLILILTVFYLGKFHDYTRDFTKSQGNLYEIVFKFKKKFPSPHGSITNKIYKLANNSLDDFKDIEKNLSYMKRLPIGFLLVAVTLIAYALVLISTDVDYNLQNDFFIIILLLLLIFAEFVTLWGIYEVIISVHQKALKGLLFTIAALKAEID